MRRSLVIVGLVVVMALVFGLAVSWLAPPTTGPAPEPPRDPEIFRLEDHRSGFYPYLNNQPAFGNRSPINVVMKANLSEVLTALQERSDGEWNDTTVDPGEDEVNESDAGGVNITGTGIAWGQARGTARYAYLHDGWQGAWVRESAQVHDGSYFGYRYHIRLYESPHPEEPWVAMQVHSEHFDWFTLRHAVDGVQDAQRRLETDLMDQPYIERVWREQFGNDGASDSDGWGTVIEIAMLAPIFATAAGASAQSREIDPWRAARTVYRRARQRLTPRHWLLAAAIVSLLLGVRVAGNLLESHTQSLSVYAIGALLYPMLAFGIPVATYVIAHKLVHRIDAGLIAAGALGTAILVDYAYLGVDVLPLDILVHRVILIVAIGLIAAGAAKRAARRRRFNATLATGAIVWAALLTATLLGWV